MSRTLASKLLSRRLLNRRLLSRRLLSQRRLRTFWLCLLLCPLLVGCVDYDLTIQFDSQTHGEIVQTIHLSDRLLALNESDRTTAFNEFSTRARALSGKAHRIDTDTLKVTIPFYNGAQLVEKFNSFYDSNNASAIVLSSLPGAPNIYAHLDLSQQNYLFALKNTLTYDLQIDQSETLNITKGLTPGLNDLSWLNLDFHLVTPWGIVSESENSTPDWHLAATQPHHIQATFWIPSPIGIGAGLISIFCGLGYLIKHKLLSKLPTTV